tara:strand:+ start:114 stop:596 length:483 start_codon:yes stop_codon:yes gene_type:complete
MMEDLAELVVEKLRLGDGTCEISVFQEPGMRDYTAKSVLVTPVTSSGVTTFDARFLSKDDVPNFFGIGQWGYGDLSDFDGVNFKTAEAAATYLVEHGRSLYKDQNKAYLSFVHTKNPKRCLPHLCIDLGEGTNVAAASLCNVLRTIVFMRPLDVPSKDAE